MRKMLLFVASLLGTLMLSGWDYPLSDETLSDVDWGVDYSRVRERPEDWGGTTLLLGGLIVEHLYAREGSTLEILCYRLDRRDRPEEADPECGRFLAESVVPLDPERYSAGRRVTLTGTVAGRRPLPLGDAVYPYPVFTIGEIHLWPRSPERPLYPWYDDPFCGPFRPWPYGWHDPWYRGHCW